MFLTLPLDTGRRLPQSVQKISDPIAAILDGVQILSYIRVSSPSSTKRVAQHSSVKEDNDEVQIYIFILHDLFLQIFTLDVNLVIWVI